MILFDVQNGGLSNQLCVSHIKAGVFYSQISRTLKKATHLVNALSPLFFLRLLILALIYFQEISSIPLHIKEMWPGWDIWPIGRAFSLSCCWVTVEHILCTPASELWCFSVILYLGRLRFNWLLLEAMWCKRTETWNHTNSCSPDATRIVKHDSDSKLIMPWCGLFNWSTTAVACVQHLLCAQSSELFQSWHLVFLLACTPLVEVWQADHSGN